MKYRNYINTKLNKKLISLTDYSANCDSKPRTAEDNIAPPKKIVKLDWCFENSLFKNFKPDTEELLMECFETDWNNSKIKKLIKNEDE